MAAEPFVLLVTGFLLTSVAGGALASGFQRRAWRHQYDVQRADHLREQAMKTFEEVSSLLDQRLYRMRLLCWATARKARDASALPVEPALADYRAILRVWNDNLNRILAVIDTYFGEALRLRLETVLYAEYFAAGEELDEFVREVAAANGERVRVRPVNARLNELSREVYAFNVLLLRSLRDGRLGEAAVTELPASVGRKELRFGHKGEAVRRLQEALRAAGATGLGVDGHFWRATEHALRAFQRAHGLPDTGIADSVTLETLAPSGR